MRAAVSANARRFVSFLAQNNPQDAQYRLAGDTPCPARTAEAGQARSLIVLALVAAGAWIVLESAKALQVVLILPVEASSPALNPPPPHSRAAERRAERRCVEVIAVEPRDEHRARSASGQAALQAAFSIDWCSEPKPRPSIRLHHRQHAAGRVQPAPCGSSGPGGRPWPRRRRAYRASVLASRRRRRLQPMHCAASIARSATPFGTGAAFASGAEPARAVMKPLGLLDAWSNAVRSVTRSLMTGKARTRYGSTEDDVGASSQNCADRSGSWRRPGAGRAACRR